MEKVNCLREIIKFNSGFKTAVNLYLNLNKPEKISAYILTKSSINLIGQYVKAVIEKKEQATLLIGSYGKGKSYLVLVLMAILSMERTKENNEVMERLIEQIYEATKDDSTVARQIEQIWNDKRRFLPVLITNSTGDLNQAFLYGLNDALKREKLMDLIPDTYYSIALKRLEEWKDNYKETYEKFGQQLRERGKNVVALKAELKLYSKEALNLFREIYPKVTAGSEFNPMAMSEVLPLYKNVSEKLVDEYNFRGIYIVFDEFSKFIESQDGTAAGNNMKLLQDICELATESSYASVFFTMIAHKSVKEYGKYLSSEIINSFTGIEGRIIEKYFITSSQNNYELMKSAIEKDENKLKDIPYYNSLLGKQACEKYFQLPAFRSNFSKRDFEHIVLKGCYPLNPISSYLLLNISEKVAQNERTLFTFISNDEPNSMARFVKEHTKEKEWSIGADLIYDYFEPLFKKGENNEFIHNIWLGAEYALDKCKSEEQRKIIKSLAVVLIVNKEDEIPANEKYLSLCVDVEDCSQIVSELDAQKIIYKKSSTGTYVFKTRAGSHLKSEIKKQRELKKDNINYAKVLSEVTGRYYVIPRKYNTEHQMTRYFVNQYMDVKDFLTINSADVLLSDMTGDGKVVTLFSFTPIEQECVRQRLEVLKDSRIIVVCPKKKLTIEKQLCDFEIVQQLGENYTFTEENDILKKELQLLVDDLTKDLESKLSEIYEEDSDTKVFYFNGKNIQYEKARKEERVVNRCCEIVYYKTALINNEMINRSKIRTAQTKKARLNIIQAIIENKDDEQFYSGSNQEATIYRSLFCQTNIISQTPQEQLTEILMQMNEFIDSCCDMKKCINILMEKLTNPPYGLRAGVIPIYFAHILRKRKEDIIIYRLNKEIQVSAEIVVDMFEQPKEYAIYVSKKDLQKEKYIEQLNELFEVEENRNLSSNRIKNIFICMQRWFRALPQVSRNLTDIEKYVSKNKMNHMKIMKKNMKKIEFNCFEILFVTFQEEFQTKSLEDTYRIIAECKTAYDDYFQWVQKKAENIIYKVWGERRKKDLYHTLTEWYENQSGRSKQGLYSESITAFMSCINEIKAYNDFEITLKIAKSVTNVYLENWNTPLLEQFESQLSNVKKEVESMEEENHAGEFSLTFTGHNGNQIQKLYNYASEQTGSVLRNIIEDALEEYDDLSINDRVSILLEMIEKIIK